MWVLFTISRDVKFICRASKIKFHHSQLQFSIENITMDHIYIRLNLYEISYNAWPTQIISKEEAKRLNAVQSSFDDADSIAKAIGNASKVVVTIGPTENGPTAEVSTSDALQVIQAAQLAGVGHVAVIYDENSTGNSSTYNVLDGISSFFNNLFSRSQPLTVQEFLQKVIETDVKYTFIKTSLTDDFTPESSYNVVVLGEGGRSSAGGANDYKVM